MSALGNLLEEIDKIRSELDLMKKEGHTFEDETLDKVGQLENAVEELGGTIWNLDSSTSRNLLFYGIQEETEERMELAVREVCFIILIGEL